MWVSKGKYAYCIFVPDLHRKKLSMQNPYVGFEKQMWVLKPKCGFQKVNMRTVIFGYDKLTKPIFVFWKANVGFETTWYDSLRYFYDFSDISSQHCVPKMDVLNIHNGCFKTSFLGKTSIMDVFVMDVLGLSAKRLKLKHVVSWMFLNGRFPEMDVFKKDVSQKGRFQKGRFRYSY